MPFPCDICGTRDLCDRHEKRPHKCDDDGSEKSYGRKENLDRHRRKKHQKDRDCNEVEEYAPDLTNESLSTPQNSSMAGLPHKMPFTNPNSSNRLVYHADVESQVHDYRMPQHHGNQQGPPANLSYDYQDTLVSEQSPDFQLFNQPSYVTEVGNPGVATVTNPTLTHYQISQRSENPLTDTSCLAPEMTTSTHDYPSTFHAPQGHNSMLPDSADFNSSKSSLGVQLDYLK
ncbi:hypothetical protein FocTR4_00012286 [Fusarium oxysporum f. sp. cubense]|nr:hypothetical protein FocTR4_00012286 [Fusarium oxysporum f. sp. cubense]